MRGKSSEARKKTPRAGRSSALNRRSCSHIGGHDLQQAIFDQPLQKFRKIRAEQFSVNVEFRQKILISSINAGRRSRQLPHPRASLIQTEITFRLQIQEHRLSIENPHQHMLRNSRTIHERHHQRGHFPATLDSPFLLPARMTYLVPGLYSRIGAFAIAAHSFRRLECGTSGGRSR